MPERGGDQTYQLQNVPRGEFFIRTGVGYDPRCKKLSAALFCMADYLVVWLLRSRSREGSPFSGGGRSMAAVSLRLYGVADV